jgi:hypothetical protein
MRLGVVAISDPVPAGMSGARRRARAEAARSKSVSVRLSPDEAAVIGEAAGRAGMSVGAWVGETAVGRARAQAAGDEPGEASGVGPSSWPELVAALVALRAEVAVRRVPVVKLDPAAELPDDQHAHDNPGSTHGSGADWDGVVGVLRRIDAVTAAAVEAASTGGRRPSRPDRERPVRS